MTFRGERAVSNLCGLESNNHVGSTSKHRQVTSNRGRERYLEPVVGTCVGEGCGKHLHHWHIRGKVRKNRDNQNEPVHTGYACHLVGTSTHGQVEECLGDTSVIEGPNENKLSNEKHQKTVIDLGQSSLGFSDKFLFFGLNLVTIHIVRFLWWERVAFCIVFSHVRLGVVVLTLVGGKNHQNGSGTNRNDTHIETHSKANKKGNHNHNLQLRPDRPSVLNVTHLSFGLFGSSLSCIVRVFLGKHLGSAVAGKHNANILHQARRTWKQLASVVQEHHGSIKNGSNSHRKNHVHKKLRPANIVVCKRHNENVLRITSHGVGRPNVGSRRERKKVR
mmetsp:Transcript_18092/g.32733  ORF Transcript_18092/g.32733 Transcript_18092/m.32733 type:complete len:333 (+) Transcript_18092:240-1238(+)